MQLQELDNSLKILDLAGISIKIDYKGNEL